MLRKPPKGDPRRFKKADPSAESSGRPEYIDIDPPCNSQYSELLKTCSTTDVPTRSQMKRLPREPLCTTLKSEFDMCKAECLEAFTSIVEQCNEQGKLFFDKAWFMGRREHLYPAGSPDDCTVGMPSQLIRVEDYFKNTFNLDQVLVFDGIEGEEVDGSDIMQGSVGDCFLIGAISGLANYTKRLEKRRKGNPDAEQAFTDDADPVQRIFVAYDPELSVYGLMFYKMGGWEWVIIDGLMAANDEGQLLYASCGEEQKELWPMVLEKAYAKLYGCWDCVDGGFSAAALATMTGGYELSLSLDDMKWKPFQKLLNDPLVVICCGVKDEIEVDEGGEAGRCGELAGPQGLIKGHAYTVVDARQVDKKGFIRVRNPWGNDAEWTGDWSDKSQLWDEHSEYKGALDYTDEADGTFWMSFEDFQSCMTVEGVRFFPDDWQVLTIYGQSGTGNANDHTYVIKLDAETEMGIVLGQSDYKVAGLLLGQTEEAHQIAKGSTQWSDLSEELGLVVRYHGEKAPANQKSIKKGQIVLEESGSGEALVGQIKPAQAGYYSFTQNLSKDTQYYVRVIVTFEVNATLYRQSGGLESAVGFSEFTLEEVDEDEEGAEEEAAEAEEEEAAEGDEEEAPTPEQVEEIKKQFKAVDKNGDGIVSKKELRQMMTKLNPNYTNEELEDLLAGIDSNEDGKVQVDEFIDWIFNGGPEEAGEQAE